MPAHVNTTWALPLSLPRQVPQPRVSFTRANPHSFKHFSDTMNNEPHQHGSSSNQTQLQTSATRNDSPQDLVQNPHVSEPTLHLHRPRPNLNPKATIKRDAFALNHCFVILSQWQVSRYARHQTDETLERVSTLLNIPNAKFWSNPTIGRNQLEEHVAYAVMCAVCSYGCVCLSFSHLSA
jgi:DnaJ-domain-containing protein 1